MNSEAPFTNEEVPNTPFRILGNEQSGYFVALGLHRITETMKNKRALHEQISRQDWHFMTNVIAAIHQQLADIKKQ